MTRTEELIRLREDIKALEYKASNEPAIIRQGGVDIQIKLLKQKERELLETMSYEEIHGAEIGARQHQQQLDEENKAKSKRTIVIASSVAGFIIIASIITAIIIKKRKK